MPEDLYCQIAVKIIEKQESIIGPIAVDQAQLVPGLTVEWSQRSVQIQGEPQAAIDSLVHQYQDLFGLIAVETCRDTVSQLVDQLPVVQRPSTLN